LTFATVRIECRLADGKSSVGTGFFFLFPHGSSLNIPAIITNNHVVKNSVSCHFRLTTRDSDGNPNYQDAIAVDLPLPESGWIKHPDPSVDLALFPIAPLLTQMQSQAKSPHFVPFAPGIIPDAAALLELGAVEDVLMIGYPNGLWDSVNNRPIVRTGATATHPAIDYEGRREFMIDAACFPGSSGSPVVLLNQSSYQTRAGNIMMGQGRMLLLGVLYAGPMYTANGEIRVVDVPTQLGAVALSAIPMNLGLVIKSSRIMEFEPVFHRLAGATPPVAGN